MIRTVLYGILLGVIGYALILWQRVQKASPVKTKPNPNISHRYRTKDLRALWIQVYETASESDARLIQARLQEEEVECLLYEQGKKDIHGNPLKGIGIAVPKSSVPLAQKIISRMPV